MLRRLYIENFKSWENLDIDFSSVTGIFGPNSSGKSTIIQFLLLLKQTKNATDRGLVLDFGSFDDYVSLGGFQDVAHKHNIEKEILW
ncbi:AAA family ATPase, partial [Pseudomonas aeruginosa]